MTSSETTISLHGHAVPTGLHIAGHWEDSSRMLDVTDPATGSTIGSVADATPNDAVRALDAAAGAQREWARWTPRARAELFHRAYDLLHERADAFADLMTLESGKPRTESVAEFALSVGFFRWFAEQIAHLHGTYSPSTTGPFRVITTLQPVGPALLVTPWNFPLLMNARKGGAALAAGCTVILKSAKETPFTAALFVQTLADAGFPPGVVNLLHTSDSAALTAPVMADRRLRKVSFTGSTGTGSLLLGQAATSIMNASMELGGDGPFIVLDDADVDLAVREALVCKFRNAGQACVSANRIILHEAIAEEFTEKFLRGAAGLKVGNGFDPQTAVGPMISAAQRERVVRLIDDFLTSGAAELLAGGSDVAGDGYFFEPTVMRFTTADHPLCNEEIFGPVAALYTVRSAREALTVANDTPYGLAAYLFTSDVSRMVVLAEELDFGMVGVNRGVMAEPSAPFGGVKASGLGREGGHAALHDFLEPKYIALTVSGLDSLD
jgi:succinate-semialdehyde dehydrogenase/glutarate-semialdehyde dehydrogenase